MNNILQFLLQGILTSALVLSISLIYQNYQQNREHKNKRNENLKIFYSTEYLSDDIKTARKRLEVDQYTDPAEKCHDQYSLSIALQRIGIMIYIGGIDLSFAILMNGYQILEDWILIHSFVNHKLRYSLPDNVTLPCERRHAEWLALIVYQYLCHDLYSDMQDKRTILKNFENLYQERNIDIVSFEREIFHHDKSFVCPHTSALVKKIRKAYIAKGNFRTYHSGDV